jgi:hypothetical protein
MVYEMGVGGVYPPTLFLEAELSNYRKVQHPFEKASVTK